jgi:hypothetical protein
MTFVVSAVMAVLLVAQFALLYALSQTWARARAVINSNAPTSHDQATKADGFFWEQWCHECGVGGARFRVDGTKTLTEMVREWWDSLWPMIWLQRIGVMAPLFGVVFTALGLITFNESQASDSASILAAIKPFAYGIGGGALVAIVNQFVMLGSEFLFRAVQSDVSSFAVDAIDKARRNLKGPEIASLPPETQLFLDKLTGGIGPLVDALGSASRHLDGTQQIQQSCLKAIDSLAEGVRQLEIQAERQKGATTAYVDSIEKGVLPSQKELQKAAKKVSDVAIALATPLENFLKATERLVVGYETASEGMQAFGAGTKAFARVVDEGFVPSAEKHHQAAKELETMVVRSRQAADGFVGGISRFAKSFEYQHEVTDRIVELIDQQAAPAYERLSKSAKELEDSTTKMTESTEGFRAAVLEQTALSRQIQETSEQAAAAIADAGRSLAASTTHVFMEPVAASARLLERFEAVPRGLEPFVESLRETAATLSKTTREQASFSAGADASLAATRAAADKLIGVAGSLESNIVTLTQAARSAGDLYSRFDAVTDGHAKKIRDASEPLVDRLTVLADTLKKLSVQLDKPKRGLFGGLFG